MLIYRPTLFIGRLSSVVQRSKRDIVVRLACVGNLSRSKITTLAIGVKLIKRIIRFIPIDFSARLRAKV